MNTTGEIFSRFKNSFAFWISRPVLATILRQPWFCRMVILFSALQLVAAFFEFPLFSCPLLQTLGIPCPGCGLTRSLRLLLAGRWEESLTLHLFSPVATLALAFLLAGCTMPANTREKVASLVERFERATGLSQSVFLLLCAYWVIRLAFFPDQISLLRTN